MAAYAGPTQSELKPDTDTIWQFSTWWFHHCTQGQIEIGWMDRDGRGLIHFRQFEIGDEDLYAVASEVSAVPGQSVYFRASTVRKQSGFTTDGDFVQSPGVWGDIDNEEQMTKAKGVQTLIRPNASVITGMYPSMRAQTFFRCAEPIVEADMVRGLNRRILALYGGDPAVINPTRLMRLPGTIAWPWKDGRIPELTTFAIPTDGRPSVYPVGMLVSQLPQEMPTAVVPSTTLGMKATLNLVSERIRLVQENQEWHNNVLRLVAHWVGRGWSNAEILAAAYSFTLPSYSHQQTQTEVAKAIEGARKKWGVPDVAPSITTEPAKPFEDKVCDPWDTLQGAPVFPLHVLPEPLYSFVESRSRVMGVDPGALAWTCLSACSAALDGQARMRMKRHDTWSVPPALWVALVGASSTKKSPIMTTAWEPLDKRQNVILRANADQQARWKALPKAEREELPPPPPPTRLITHDATMEKVQELLSTQTRGIGMLRDELAGFIGGMEKYSGGKSGGAADRAFFLQAYNGGSHVVDRIGRGTSHIENLLITICGGIQPDRLSQFSGLTDDGLWQRFIPVIVQPGQIGSDEAPGPESEAYDALVGVLFNTDGATRGTFAEDAFAVRDAIEQEVFDLEQSAPLGSRFSSFCGKLPGIFGRLCLVLSHIKGGMYPWIVQRDTAEAARVLVMRSILPHAAMVYQAMGDGSATLEVTQAIAGYLLTKHVERVTAGILSGAVRCCRNQPLNEIQRMLSPLVAGGWLSPEKEHGGNNAWLVNPIVHEQFRERTETETKRRARARSIIHGQEDEDGEV